MTADDLGAPLGRKPARKRRIRLPFTPLQALTVALALILMAFCGIALFGNNPDGGEPIVRLALKTSEPPPAKTETGHQAEPAAKPPAKPEGDSHSAPPAAAPGQHTVTIIDGSSGARQSVVIGAAEPGKDGGAVMAGVDPRLLEKGRYGMIPTAAGSAKPVNVYAESNDALRARAASMPVIAIVVGGLGVGAAKTNDAILRLPGAVTLAFTPYGTDPGKLVERARALHHEVLLQVPMEPFDYPDNDPGPQALLTSLEPEQNLDRLSWHMSRIQGYVGLANFMGARFVATDAAMQAVLRDAAKRGLAYFDDGATPRSVASVVAEGLAMPFARADSAIDLVPTQGEIDRALAALETRARERGSAIGFTSALPVAVERIAAWAKQLEARGILLVPLTSIMLKSKSS